MVPVVARAGCRGEDEDRRDDHEPKRDVRIKVATTIRFPLRAMGAFGDWLGSEGHADAWSCCGSVVDASRCPTPGGRGRTVCYRISRVGPIRHRGGGLAWAERAALASCRPYRRR